MSSFKRHPFWCGESRKWAMQEALTKKENNCSLMTAKKLSVDDTVIQMDFSQKWDTWFCFQAFFHVSNRQPHAETRDFHFLNQPGLCAHVITLLCHLMLLWLLKGLSKLKHIGCFTAYFFLLHRTLLLNDRVKGNLNMIHHHHITYYYTVHTFCFNYVQTQSIFFLIAKYIFQWFRCHFSDWMAALLRGPSQDGDRPRKNPLYTNRTAHTLAIDNHCWHCWI